MAVAWVHKNIARYGGRPDQLFLSGHSAGGHLVALLGTDPTYLEAAGVPLKDIKGVIPISGVYTFRPGSMPKVFGEDREAYRKAAPLTHVKKFHWVMDNLNTHWTLELCRYLAAESGCWVKGQEKRLRTGKARRALLAAGCGRHVVHFTPKHGSWLNQIEIWFGVLSRRVLRRGDFTSVEDLARKIRAYIAHYNAHFAHPYEWTYTGKPGASGDKRKRKRLRFRRRQLVNMRSP